MKRYEETLHQFQKDLERAQDNHRNSTLQVNDFSSHFSQGVSRTRADHFQTFHCFADWKPREKCAELKSAVSRCPWQPQRSNGSGKLLTLLSLAVAFDEDVSAYSKAFARAEPHTLTHRAEKIWLSLDCPYVRHLLCACTSFSRSFILGQVAFTEYTVEIGHHFMAI